MSSRKRWIRAAALVGAGSLLLAACGSSSKTTSGSTPSNSAAATSAASTEPVTLRVAFWGEFGFKELQAAYKAVAPNVTLKLESGQYANVNGDLQKFLIAGSGAPDVQAIDEGYIVQYRNEAQYFVNLAQQPGGAAREGDYLPWKWKESLGPNGEQIGFGTDIGGQALCYRTDLFKAAGLPTDRDAVSKLWSTWADFENVGKQYVAKTGKKFIDNATNILNPILAQQPVGYFTSDEKLALEGGPKTAWDQTLPFITDGLSANIAAWTPQWDAGFKSGSFAVLACPAWMIGHIQEAAPTTSGKWDIAQIPGGGGNWGGSFLTIPKQSKHADAAYAFINWFTQPAQLLQVFKTVGNLPSEPALYTDPSFTSFTKPFFNNAPTGVIFAKTAQNLQPQYLGKLNGAVRTAVENVLQSVQDGKVKAADGWAAAVAAGTKASQG